MLETLLSGSAFGRALVNKKRLRDMFRVGNHVVVFGVSPLMFAVQRRLADANRPVLVVANNDDALQSVLGTGAALLVGSVDDAAVEKASEIWFVGQDDAQNIRNAEAVERVLVRAREAGAGPIRLLLEVKDSLARARLDGFITRVHAKPTAELRVFSSTQIAVRRLFRECPPEGFTINGPWQPRVAWVVGFGSLGEEIVIQLLRDGFHRNGDQYRIVIIDRQASLLAEAFRKRWPGLDSVARVRFLDIDVNSAMGPSLAISEDGSWPTAIYMCLSDHDQNLECADKLAALLAQSGRLVAPIWARVRSEPSSMYAWTAERPWLRLFGGEASAAEELVVRQRLDKLAETIHKRYCEAAIKNGEEVGERRSLRSWMLLPEDLKDDNRRVADHHFAKLREVGCRVHESSAGSKNFTLTTEEIEALAHMEHDRWLGERLLEDWHFSPARCDEKKLHPDIVPYAQLAPARQELDRNIIRDLPLLFAEANFEITRYLEVETIGPRAPTRLGPEFEKQIKDVIERLRPGPRAPFIWADLECPMACRVAEIARDAFGLPYGLISRGQNISRTAKWDASDPRIRLIREAHRTALVLNDGAGSAAWKPKARTRIRLLGSHETTRQESGTWTVDASGRLLSGPA